ncbi:MAG: hypothetical protein K0R33_3083 [Mycobacterium sp.]|nr:hypothetical protein [Mycobacterium sp.]
MLPQVARGQGVHDARTVRAVLGDEHLRAGSLELPNDLGLGQARVDRRDGGAHPPRREHHDHELEAVAQFDRDHVAGTDAKLVQLTGRRPHSP